MSSPSEVVSFERYEDLLIAARNGNKDAQGQLLEACRRPLLRLARRRLSPGLLSKGAGSDVVQETFLQALREINTFRGCTPEQMLAWLRVIMEHTLSNFRRRFHSEKREVGAGSVGEDGGHPGRPAPRRSVRKRHGDQQRASPSHAPRPPTIAGTLPGSGPAAACGKVVVRGDRAAHGPHHGGGPQDLAAGCGGVEPEARGLTVSDPRSESGRLHFHRLSDGPRSGRAFSAGQNETGAVIPHSGGDFHRHKFAGGSAQREHSVDRTVLPT